MTGPNRLIVPSSATIRYTPECNLQCKGTDRPVWDKPVDGYKTPDGVKHLVCKCCHKELRLLGPNEAIAAPVNVMPGIDVSKFKRFVCDQCGYDLNLLPELKEMA